MIQYPDVKGPVVLEVPNVYLLFAFMLKLTGVAVSPFGPVEP